jgi:hypothetical protein
MRKHLLSLLITIKTFEYAGAAVVAPSFSLEVVVYDYRNEAWG